MLTGCISLTLTAWYATSSAVDAQTRSQFDFAAGDIADSISERLQDYEQVLLGGTGLFAQSQTPTRDQWRSYIDALRIPDRLPGVRALGYLAYVHQDQLDVLTQTMQAQGVASFTVRPPGPRDDYAPVIYSEPRSPNNLGALGFDVMSEPVRRTALEIARDNNIPVLSGKVTLLGETNPDAQAGFLMFMPVFRGGHLGSTADRRANVAGYVFGAFNAKELMSGIFEHQLDALDLEIYDGLEVREDALLFRSWGLNPQAARSGDGGLERSLVRAVTNRPWTFRVVALPAYRAMTAHGEPRIILLGGIALGLLATLALLVLARARAETTAVNAQLIADITHREEVEEQFRRSEERFRHVAEVSGDWIWETGPDHRFTYFSERSHAQLASYGFPGNSALGKRRWEFPGVDTANEELWHNHKADLAARRPFRNFRYSLTNPVGVRQYMTISGTPIFDAARKFQGYRGTSRDETAIVSALERAEKAEAILQDAVDSISEGFIIFDHEDRFVMCNEAMRRLDPHTKQNHAPGVRFVETLHGGLRRGAYLDAIGREEEWVAERLAQHNQPSSVVETRLSDGRWILVSERRMRNGGIAGLRIDITALKIAQQAALESERLARDIIGGALDAFIQMNEAGVVTEWNPQAEAVFGWSKSEALGKPLTALIIPAEHREQHQLGLVRFLGTGESSLLGKRLEIGAIRRDGRAIQVELSITALHRADGYVFNGFLRDITEKLAAEQHLRHMQKMDAIGQLTGGLAHDFNNLLGIIIGNLDLLQELSRDDPKTNALARDVLEAALHGADLTRRLLAFGRRQPLQPETIDLPELIGGLARLLGRTLGGNVEIVQNLAPETWPVLADPAQLQTALANLATNARDAMPKGGRIVVTTANSHLDRDCAVEHPDMVPGDYVVIEVSDTGTGMPPDVLNRIFEPFFTTKEPGKGTGLGLSMVFGFIKQSGGHVTARSEPGRGSTFQFYLPRADRSAAKSAGEASRPLASQGVETILVVEDNPHMRRVLLRHLTALGYRTLEAENSAAALEILEEPDHIDLLLSDIVMPGEKDGWDLALEASECRPGLKVLLTSGFPEARLGASRPRAGGCRVLSKPYRKHDLAQAVRGALDEQKKDRADGPAPEDH